MDKNINNRKNIGSALLCVLLTLVMLALGAVHAYFYTYKYGDESVADQVVNSSDDFKNIGLSFYNDNVHLASDIVLDGASPMTNPDRPFSGTFDGHGHSITLQGVNAGAIFGYIAESGVVQNVEIILSNCSFESNYVGLLAYENRGTVQNVKISGSITLPDSGTFALVAAVNRGTIEAIYAEQVKLYRETTQQVNNPAFVFGVACAYNYATVKSAIVKASYTNVREILLDNVYGGNYVNFGVGGICGINENGTISSSLLSVEKGVTTSDAREHGLLLTNDNLPTYNELVEKYGFDDAVWKNQGSKVVLAITEVGGAA